MSSSSKELSKFEKEKQKLIQEKCQGLLNEMLRDDDNKYCVDCDAKGPRWASWNLGIFLCIRCAGIHRNLGVHISRVKSVNLDSWTPEQVVTMQQMGNSRARAVYEANLPDNFRRPQTDVALENFIRAKYEHTKYIAQEWVKPAAPRVDWNAEVEEQIRKKKEKKSADAAAGAMLPKFGAGLASSRLNSSKATSASKSSNSSSSSSNNHHSKSIAPPPLGKIEVPQPVTAQAAVTTASSASEDLLGLTTLSSPTSDDPFASPVKNNSHQVPSGAAVSAAPSTTAQESKSNEEELGAVFTQDPISQQKMTKESILSLYGSLGGGGGGGGTGMVGGGLGGIQMPSAAVPAGAAVAANNPFGQFMGASSNTNHQQQSTNPFPTSQQGIFSDLIGNGFGGGGGGLVGVGMGAPAPAATNQLQQSNLSQLQQGLFSLNLGGVSAPVPQQQQQPPQPHLQQQSNSNLLFNSPPPPSTNLNMLMMNNSSAGGGMGSGYFGGGSTTTGFIGMGAPQQQQQQPGSLMMTSAPQQQNFQQFQQQQPHQFNQFNQFQQAASSPFQNGGTPAAATTVAAAAATAGGGLLGAGSNSDLLWK